MDGFAIDFDVSCRGERNQGELVADNEIHFFCPWIGFVIVNITEIICATSDKFDVNHIFQSPAYVLSGHRVLSVVLESRVYDKGFGISDTILTFEGVLGENLDEECLTEIVRVFFAGLVIDTEDSGHVIVVNFLASVIDQVIGNLSQSIDITDFEAAFDVFLQDGTNLRFNSLVVYVAVQLFHQFRAAQSRVQLQEHQGNFPFRREERPASQLRPHAFPYQTEVLCHFAERKQFRILPNSLFSRVE